MTNWGFGLSIFINLYHIYMHGVFEVHIPDLLVGFFTIEEAGTSVLLIVHNCGSFIAISVEFINMSAYLTLQHNFTMYYSHRA